MNLKDKKGFICDMDGVIYHGNKLLPGVREFVDWLHKENRNYLFLTNSPERSPEELRQKLLRMGLDVDESHFYTSAQATAKFLGTQSPDCSAFVIGGAGLTTALRNADIRIDDVNPDYVIVGEGSAEGSEYNYDNIIKATKFVCAGAKLIGTNSDSAIPAEQGVIPGCHSLLSPIEMATGKSAYFIGKPNLFTMRAALAVLGIPAEDAVMIGDRMDTDILSGVDAGIDTVLVLSGICSSEDVELFPFRPTYILPGVGDIPALS